MCLLLNGLGTSLSTFSQPTHIPYLAKDKHFIKGGKALWKETRGNQLSTPHLWSLSRGLSWLGLLPPSTKGSEGGHWPRYEGFCDGREQSGKGSQSFLWGLEGKLESLAEVASLYFPPPLPAGRWLLTYSFQKGGLIFSFPQKIQSKGLGFKFCFWTVPLFMGI